MRRVCPRVDYTQAPWTVVMLRQSSQSVHASREASHVGILLLVGCWWVSGGHLTVESVGISVWWSDFSILQAFCKETQPNNLLPKYLEQFHEAPAII